MPHGDDVEVVFRRCLQANPSARSEASTATSKRDENARNVGMKIEVVCYSGYKGDERPVRFRLGGQDYLVEELLDQWCGPHDIFFKLRANDGNMYILRRRPATPDGEWSLESFREMR